MIFEENLQYRHEFDSVNVLPLEWKLILNWIGKNKSVLEVGCHAGDLSQLLKQEGCAVTGIELNNKALEVARPFLEQAISGDIELQQTWDQLGGKKFDAVIYEHVLEHLSDPWTVLANTKNYLAKDGIVVIALPNISNADSRFNMLFGKFNYEEIGVMDRTHLRFFNQATAREMISKAGFKIDDYGSSMQVNPLWEFIDHMPLLTWLRFLFSTRPSKVFGWSPNITDVIMMFKCSVC